MEEKYMKPVSLVPCVFFGVMALFKGPVTLQWVVVFADRRRNYARSVIFMSKSESSLPARGKLTTNDLLQRIKL